MQYWHLDFQEPLLLLQCRKLLRAAPEPGYQLDALGNCTNIEADCDTQENDFVCRINGTTGAQAWGKDSNGDCVVKLYRPE
ncbi:hypothetical protein ACQ9BO_09345 [Flavobacterium sp. P21]|uniref:hypothetical protein n=1 Tax=Flavobacterium sp. P21 TaxID=3423948 RepID=UPI003D67D904